MMTACGSSDNNATSSESTAQTTAGGTETSRSGDNDPKESTGVIDGMMDDVEDGVEGAVDGMTGNKESGSSESR